MRSASNAPARSLPAFPSPPALRSAASGPCSSASQKATESVSGRGVPFPSSSLFASPPVRIPTQDDASRGTAAGARKCGAPHGASAAGSTRRPESTLPMRACSGRAPCNHHAPSTLLPQKCPCTNSPDVPFRSCCGSSWRRVQQRRRCTGPEVAGGGGGPRMSPPSAGECAPGLMHAPQPFLRAARRRLASVLAPRPPRSPLGRRSAESRGRPPRRCAFVLLYAGGGVRVDDADAGHTHTAATTPTLATQSSTRPSTPRASSSPTPWPTASRARASRAFRRGLWPSCEAAVGRELREGAAGTARGRCLPREGYGARGGGLGISGRQGRLWAAEKDARACCPCRVVSLSIGEDQNRRAGMIVWGALRGARKGRRGRAS